MISEVDVRDWARQIADAEVALDDLKNENPTAPNTSAKALETFINNVEKLVKQNSKQIPALFKVPV